LRGALPRPWLAALALACALGLVAVGPAAAGTACPDEIKQLGLARALLAEGDYFRAITELKRFLFLYPESPQAPEARFSIADALLAAGRLNEAEAAFRELRSSEPAGGPGAERAAFGQALALLRLGERQKARALLRELAAGAAESPYRVRAQLELALSLAEEGEWSQARDELRAASPAGPGQERRLAALHQAEGRAKSPGLAGALSALLPGAGQLYCGRVRDAGLALLLNGLFIWGATEAGLRENYALAAGLGLIELAWYGGTIYGAVNCAYKQNRAEAERLREDLLRQPEAGGPTFTLAWGCRF
jgi:tetratricopeptide (TPR) repeat protein